MNSFDIVIIGSGAGGGTIARELAGTGAKILIVERGDFIPQEDHNWNPASVWKDLRYRTTETWLDEHGRAFRPYTHYCVGGNTKFWGTVMYRLRPEDFKECSTPTACRRRGRSTTTRSRRTTIAPRRMYDVHGEAGLDPDRGAARTVSVSAGPALRGRRRHRRTAEGAGAASVAAAARPRARTAFSATPAIRSRARSTRRATPTSAACGRPRSRRTSRCGPTRSRAS